MRQGMLGPLREARFAWYYAARVVSMAGSAMAPIALTFAVLAITHSATALGLVLAARTVPMVLFLLIGGVVSDRFSRTAVIRIANLLSGATQAAAAALVITGTADLWMLAALEALNGTVSAFTFPAMTGVVPQLVARDQLQPANALLSFSRSGLTIIGPTVAALLVASVGPGWALAGDAPAIESFSAGSGAAGVEAMGVSATGPGLSAEVALGPPNAGAEPGWRSRVRPAAGGSGR
jgi:MFS family permease